MRVLHEHDRFSAIRASKQCMITWCVIKMSSMCSNTSSKTWKPLSHRFINKHLVEMFPLFDQARLQLIDVTNESGDDTHAYAASPKSHSLSLCSFFCLNTLMKTRSSAENVMFIIYINCLLSTQRHIRTTDCSITYDVLETDIFCHCHRHSIFEDD